MKLHFLGTTGYHPNNHRQTACLMLPELGLILDAGTGMFRARDLIETPTLDIFLTHIHLDHVIGLTFLYDVLFQKDVQRVTVHVAEDKIRSIVEHLYANDLFPVQPNFEFSPLTSRQAVALSGAAAGVTVNPIPVEHPGGCFAFRLEGLPSGKSLAYVTDTMAATTAPYVQEIAGVDVLIHECYFPDGWEDKAVLTGHSCLTPVTQVAKAAGVGCCYLVHINPLNESKTPFDLKQVRQHFRNLSVAHDQQVVEI